MINLCISNNFRTGKSDGWQLYSAGRDFSTCIRPGHHACLDQFRPDGNVQFRYIYPF